MRNEPRCPGFPRGFLRPHRALPSFLGVRRAPDPDRGCPWPPGSAEPARSRGPPVRPGDGQARRPAECVRRTISGTWKPRRPDPHAARTEQEPHARGDILVGAVFEAFRKMYESQVADLRRIASRGSGELPAGNLHPDLVNRLTGEASHSAAWSSICASVPLTTCRRWEITFGDFLRAALTADYDLNPADPRRYRGVQPGLPRYGICPEDVGRYRPAPSCGPDRRASSRSGPCCRS